MLSKSVAAFLNEWSSEGRWLAQGHTERSLELGQFLLQRLCS